MPYPECIFWEGGDILEILCLTNNILQTGMIIYLALLLYEILCASGTDYNLNLLEDASINDIFYDLSGICSTYELKVNVLNCKLV